MLIFNAEKIRSFKPCYDPVRHFQDSDEITVLSLLDRKDIPFEDRLWVILRTDFVSEKLMRLFAVYCARQVQHLMKDERSLIALNVSEAFANGQASIEELAAARDAARAAARDAARDAARAAARAAEDAARAAARAAAEDAAWDAQESKLREMILEGIKTGDVK